MRILLVEDDVDLSRQLKLALGDAGYAVDHAADGEEAHFLGDTEPYDVVVLDLGLPKIDGVSVLERWRRDGKTTPVLILTARGAWLGCRASTAPTTLQASSTEELLVCQALRRSRPASPRRPCRAAVALDLRAATRHLVNGEPLVANLAGIPPAALSDDAGPAA
jgi:two-component system OmpR family response regulator